GVTDAAREDQLVGEDEAAVPQPHREAAGRRLRGLDDVRGDRGRGLGEDLLPAAGDELPRRLGVATEIAVRVLDLVRTVLAGVEEEEETAEPGQPRRGGQPGGAPADHDD